MTSTEEDVIRAQQARMSLNAILEKRRMAAVEAPVREQFEDDLRALTDAEQDSKELRSAKQHLLYGRIVETVALPYDAAIAVVRVGTRRHVVAVGRGTVVALGPPSADEPTVRG